MVRHWIPVFWAGAGGVGDGGESNFEAHDVEEISYQGDDGGRGYIANRSASQGSGVYAAHTGCMRLELLDDEEALTEQDRDLLKGYGVGQLAEDLRLFAGWHEALGMDPEAALTEMRSRIREGSPD